MEPVVDHLGPHARNVDDAVLLLEVIAGKDGNDPRQANAPAHGSIGYRDLVARRGGRIDGLRVGILKEGFGFPQSDAKVDAQVWNILSQLRRIRLNAFLI